MKPLIVANWKCNPTNLNEARRLFNSVKNRLKNIKNVEVVICPPFPYLLAIKPYSHKAVKLGAQDCFWEERGAFTGEISPKMLKDLGCDYVIIGHSERRKYQKETDEIINKKIIAAMSAKLKPILCIENLSRIKKDLKGISEGDLGKLIIAYEPVFAIGTGKPCSPEKAEKMRLSIQKIIKNNSPIIYGGSVNSQNAKDYIQKVGFSGLLVGGASLNPREFLKIIQSIDPVRSPGQKKIS